ncbi:MAG: winged helix-turn-helix domain-containing protein [Chakrabartia sp.]
MSDDFGDQLRAIANPHRMAILRWLKDPCAHFPPQVSGDLVEDGVCALFIGDKLGLAQPTAAQHLKLLVDAQLLIPKRIKKWTFYRRNETQLDLLKQSLANRI